MIVVVMDPVSNWWVEDGAAAIENMLLACTALGYGACWVEGTLCPREALFKTLLGVPAEKRVMALIPIGVAAEIPAPEKKPLEKVLHWERYRSVGRSIRAKREVDLAARNLSGCLWLHLISSGRTAAL